MSIKARKFESMLGNPLNIHNFIVNIPPMKDVDLLVSATTFPTERLQEYVMFFQGERVKFPSVPINDGTWTCTMPEGEYAQIIKSFNSLMHKSYNQQTGQLTFWSIRDKFDIDVFARGIRGDVGGSDRVFGVTMHGCWLQGKAPVTLNNQSVSTPWEWQVTFSFDAVEDITPTPLGPTSLNA